MAFSSGSDAGPHDLHSCFLTRRIELDEKGTERFELAGRHPRDVVHGLATGDRDGALELLALRPEGKAVLAELDRRGLGTDAVIAIFMTHGHSDHTAGAHLFPGATIYALADDVALVEGREAAHGPLTKMAGAKPTGLHVESLKDGTTTSVGTKAIRVYAVPGHTAGSAAYLVSGVLFLGDSGAMTTDGKLDGPPWAFTDDPAKSRASLVALGDTLRPEREGVVAIVPGHTGPGQVEDLLSF